MTDRYNALIVGLEKDIREDDAQRLIDAIRMLRGVLNVTGNVSDIDSWLAEERALADLRRKFVDMLK